MESRLSHHIPGVSASIMVQPFLDAHVPYGRMPPSLVVFPIDQMKSSHVENDYIDSPAVVLQPPASQKATRGLHEAPVGGSQLARSQSQDVTHPWINVGGRPSSISSSSSASSDQRLLDHSAPNPVLEASPGMLRTPGIQPNAVCSKPVDSKGLSVPPEGRRHLLLCESCGKCRCTECTLPRTLPSCWVCNQECLCSAQSLVDCATCMCLVKGVFYHCTDDEDEEGSCAERPCSCSPSNCCGRWSFMGCVSLVLPCLLCYLPALGCIKMSQRCYDGARRPGCRCKANQVRKAGEGKARLIPASSAPLKP
uniref:Sprouty homolog 4 (Drosophila) n=1 Tax=Paramormyrops kingsleyae TaxID=1676925 RepID=A0A3B3QU42_9TELE